MSSPFSTGFFAEFRPRFPAAGAAAVGLLLAAEILLRSGLVARRVPTPTGPVRIPDDVARPIISGCDPPEIQYDEACGNVGKPNYDGWFRGSDFQTRLRLNNFGFHDTDWAVERRSREIRVAVLGMSLTAANQVPTEETWVERIETALNADGRQTPVSLMNFGVPGHFLANTQGVLSRYVLPFHPDLVVLHVAARNIESARLVKGQSYRGYAIRYVFDEDLPRIKKQVDNELSSLQQLPIRYSALARLCCHFRGRQPIVRSNAFRWLNAEREIAEYDRRPFILAIRDVCREHGIPFHVLLNGRKVDKMPLSWLFDNGIPFAVDADHVDVAEDRFYGKDGTHFNREGNRVYAEALTPVFRDWIETVSGSAPGARPAAVEVARQQEPSVPSEPARP